MNADRATVPNNAKNGTTTSVPDPQPIPHQDQKKTPRSGVPSLTFSTVGHSRYGTLAKNVKGGSLGERLEVICPGFEGGRRRASRVVAALLSTTRATALHGRRWAAADQKAGDEISPTGTPRFLSDKRSPPMHY